MPTLEELLKRNEETLKRRKKILAMVSQGIPVIQIAKDLHISRQRIYKILEDEGATRPKRK